MKQDSICWDCQRAIADPTIGCSWSRHFHPVEGWTAEERLITSVSKGERIRIKSYCVTDCPMFLPDDEADRTGEHSREEEIACRK